MHFVFKQIVNYDVTGSGAPDEDEQGAGWGDGRAVQGGGEESVAEEGARVEQGEKRQEEIDGSGLFFDTYAIFHFIFDVELSFNSYNLFNFSEFNLTLGSLIIFFCW